MGTNLSIVALVLTSVAAASEVSEKVDGPFRILFTDARLLDVKRKESTDWFSYSISVGGASAKIVTYELTLSDDLNKKFKVTFNDQGKLTHADKYSTRMGSLPQVVQSAIEKSAPSAGADAVVEARVSYLRDGFYGYKIAGKLDGKKLELEVPIVPSKIVPTAIVKGLNKRVRVSKPEDKPTDENTVELWSESTPYSAKFTYAWKQTSGEELKLPAADLTGHTLKFRVPKPGKYAFQLTVNDGYQASTSDEFRLEAYDSK
ncbi:MAG TPA: hypothetical protein VKX17_11050 [Planctomycetota bacterium]|nr:hypothetical protein [Planctomycetota bacterium]